MRILILGGTAWLGSQLVRQALERGHEVTSLARGESGTAPDGARFVRADRDRLDAFGDLGDATWDAVVDVTRQPGQARRAVEQLGSRAGHWVYVSSSSAYADTATPGVDESGGLLPPLNDDVLRDPEDYGRAKVACEGHVLFDLADRHPPQGQRSMQHGQRGRDARGGRRALAGSPRRAIRPERARWLRAKRDRALHTRVAKAGQR